MTLRQAQCSDLPAICQLWQEMADYHSELDPRFGLLSDDLDSFTRYLRGAIYNDDMRVLVAEVGDGRGIAGFAIGLLREGPRSLEGRSVGHVSDLAVREDLRRRGIGTALFQELVRWFREHEVRQVTLNVSYANKGAMAFWERQGFEEFTRRLCYQVPDDAPPAGG